MNEDRRLEILHSLQILDSPPESRFQRIVDDAKEVFKVPIVVVSLVDRDRQWFKASLGLPTRETPRSLSFCSICVEQAQTLIIEDTTQDPRVRDNPLVTGPPHIRFYAGHPLIVQGACLGTVCIIDTRPRTFSAEEARLLKVFGHWAQSELDRAQLDQLTRDLSLSQQHYKALFHTSAQAVAIFSADGEYLEGNALAEALWDVEKSGPPWLSPRTFGGSPLATGFQQALAGEASFVEPFSYIRPNGQKVYLQVSMSPLGYLGPGGGVMITVDDVTTSVLSAESQAWRDAETLREKEEAARLRARQEAYAVVLAHEMRNPVNGILGMSEMLKALCSTENLEMVQSIYQCAESLSCLIDDTLDLERIQQGRMKLGNSVFDLGAVLRSVLTLSQPQAKARSVTLVNAPREALPFVRGDESRVRQVLGNYLANAIKYSHEGGEVRIVCGASETGFLFEVIDSGVGIAEQTMETIFDPYFQVQSHAPNSKRGLGLGLNIVKKLVDLMGGHLGVESRLGEGSRFWADLPLQATSPPQEQEASARSIVARIMVVDDNAINRRILTLQLSAMGAVVEQAENGQLALEILAEQAFDVVLLDCHMPVLDGFATARALRAQPQTYGKPLIIALTADTSEQSREQCRSSGMDDFLSKPIRNIDLNSKLHDLLRSQMSVSLAR